VEIVMAILESEKELEDFIVNAVELGG